VSGRIRVEVASADEAAHLIAGLAGLRTDVVLQDGCYGVEVLEDRQSSRVLVGVLDAVESWLVRRRIASATVHLGERVYTLTSPGALA
jgi:hypothetical protein